MNKWKKLKNKLSVLRDYFTECEDSIRLSINKDDWCFDEIQGAHHAIIMIESIMKVIEEEEEGEE